MLVNGASLQNVELIEKKITTKDTTNVVENISTFLPPYTDRDEYNLGEIELTLGCYDDTEDGLELIKSKLVLSLSKCVLKFDDLIYYYDVAYQNKVEEDKPFINILTEKWYQKITVYFTILKKYTSEKVVVANKVLSISIDYKGTEKAPCIIEVTPTIDMIDFSIIGLSDSPIILKNLKANTKVSVDGIKKKVIRNASNDFNNTDMWGYPQLNVGINNITFSKNTCNINIKYRTNFY